MNDRYSANQRIKRLIMLITILGQASIALYLPALPVISQNLAIDAFQSKLTVTSFLLGFAVSPMFFGPISDYIGRKPILLASLTLALIGFLGNSISKTIDVFVLCRVLEGLGCGGLLTSGRSIARDVFSGKELASASSYLSMGFALGFGLSPVIGGVLVHHLDWKVIFYVLAAFDLMLILVCTFYLPETKSREESNKSGRMMNILHDYRSALFNHCFMLNVLGGFCAYCIIVLYNIVTPFLIQGGFGFSSSQYGYLAVLIGVPYFIAASINKTLVMKTSVYFSCLIGGGMITLSGFLMFALTTVYTPNIYVLIISFMVATFGQALIFSNTIAMALQLFPARSAGRISAFFSSFQMLLVSIVSVGFAMLSDKSVTSLAIVIFALGAGALICIFASEKAGKVSKTVVN